MRGAMDVKIYAAGLCVAVIAVTAIAVAPVAAQTKKKQYVYTTAPDRPVTRPRARVTVAPRSFLDAGTEVLPGERKFTDTPSPRAHIRCLWAWCKARAGAWAGTSRRRRDRSIFRAAIIRTVGNSALRASTVRGIGRARSAACPHCAVILAACAVSVQFLRSVAMVR